MNFRRTHLRSAWRRPRTAVGEALLRVRAMPRAFTYPLLGSVFALAMPLGLPAAHALDMGQVPWVTWVLQDAARYSATYAYVTVASLAVATSLGFLLGRWFDDARLLSFTDPLTGLFNRRYFGTRLAAELRRARRGAQPTCVLYLDVDHLKALNDQFGHRAGDTALVALAATLSGGVRPGDVVARFGGDEFAVLLPETTAVEAHALAERLAGEAADRSAATAGRLGVSIGVAVATATSTPDGLLAEADTALYCAKASGGGQVASRPTSSPEPVVARLRWAAAGLEAPFFKERRKTPRGPLQEEELGGEC